MGKTSQKVTARQKRKLRIRKRVKGTADRPRLAVFRSARHIYAQIIDDDRGVTIASFSSLSPEIKAKKAELEGKKAVAKEVGRLLAERAREKGIDKVSFDRGGYMYHGRVQALADGVRDAGIKV